MTISPKVSVIIPSYNRADYICSAIDSVLNQSFKNYEIIVVDDGSTDNTKDVLRPYHDKIIYIYKENSGEPGARNTGIRASKGEYLAFLDSDDLWLPEKLELQVKFLDKNTDIALVFGNTVIFKEDKCGVRETVRILDAEGVSFSFKRLLMGNFVCGVISVLLRKDCLKTTGLFNEDGIFKSGATDYELWIRIARQYKIGYINKLVSEYRIHDSNILGLDEEKFLELQTGITKHVLQIFPSLYKEKIYAYKFLSRRFLISAYNNLKEKRFSLVPKRLYNAVKYYLVHIKFYWGRGENFL